MPAALSLHELLAAAGRVAVGLRAAGIGEGDVVALQLPNWAEAWIGYTAVLMVGGVVLPVLLLYGKTELAFVLGDARVKLLVTALSLRTIDFRARIARVYVPCAGRAHNSYYARSRAPRLASAGGAE